jgi:hypothetical protein
LRAIGAILLVDGLTSEIPPSGEQLLESTLGAHGLFAQWAPYIPYSSDGQTVETTNVFPELFGLEPRFNPGRAGLERILDGDLHQECPHFAVIKSRELASQNVARWGKLGLHLRVSRFSRSSDTWLICSERPDLIDSLVGELSPAARVSHRCSPELGWKRRASDAGTGGKFHLIGWCHGSLLAALLLCGLSYEGDMAEMQDRPSDTRNDRLKHLHNSLPRLVGNTRRPVVYVKDPAWEARKGDDKRAGIEFAGLVLRELAAWICPDSAVLVASDHNSEVGLDQTYTGVTCMGLVSANRRLVEAWSQDVTSLHSQEELMRRVASCWF